jgi:hypothetical protein
MRRMAKRTVTTLVDDLDGTDIPRGQGETVRFGIDGRNYEIDLTDENAAALRQALRPYVDAGRRVNARGARRRQR